MQYTRMARKTEIREREERAARLVQARKAAGFRGPTAVNKKFGFPINNYKAHEQGRNGFGLVDAKAYARAFNVSLAWLNHNIGEPTDMHEDSTAPSNPVPLISWVSAGALTQPDYVPERFDEVPYVYGLDLDPNGDWIALRVDGRSMDKVSPHDSIIFVNRKENTLVSTGLYILGDGNGGATYKRFIAPNKLEAVTTKKSEYPDILFDQEPEVIGRVRKTVLSL